MKNILFFLLILVIMVSLVTLIDGRATGFFYLLFGGLPGIALRAVAMLTALKVFVVGCVVLAAVYAALATVRFVLYLARTSRARSVRVQDQGRPAPGKP